MSDLKQISKEASPVEDRFAGVLKARAAAIAKRDSQRKDGAVREREPDLGGQRLKLSVHGTIPGHHLYWENDEAGKIEELLYQGFDFVAPGEVRRGSELVSDMDLSNRISRYVGKNEDGSPLRAYLLKCPDEIWNARELAGQRLTDARDYEIRNGRMKPQDSHEYVPKGYESSLATNANVK
jgi:hypothetical protein